MTDWFDKRAQQSAKRAHSSPRRRKVAQIEAALGASAKPLHELFSSLDDFERAAKAAKTGAVSPAWIGTLGKIRSELLAARDRLDNLHTGLHAEGALRTSLIQAAAGFAAWQFALQQSNPKEIAAATTRMNNHFKRAEIFGRFGLRYLKARI